MHTRHLPPIIVMMLCGMIVIRLALSPVAVTGSTCTEDHPYYLFDCEVPDWTATPVTPSPTYVNGMMDDDLLTQIPTQLTDPTDTVLPTMTPTALPTPLMQATTPTITPTLLRTPMPRTRTETVVRDSTIRITDTTSSDIACPRQGRLIISGTTTPYTLLLLRFDDRVVGGGISYASGGYAIPLLIGDESSGIHRIEIRARNTNRVLNQFMCVTP